jgi:tRNA-binding protein
VARLTIDDLHALGLCVGTVTRAVTNEGARDRALCLWIDLGEAGEVQSSAKICDLYDASSIVGRQVVVVTGFEPLRIGGFRSDVLVLGALTDEGVVLLALDRRVPPGTAIS